MSSCETDLRTTLAKLTAENAALAAQLAVAVEELKRTAQLLRDEDDIALALAVESGIERVAALTPPTAAAPGPATDGRG